MNEVPADLAVWALERESHEGSTLREIDFTYFVNNPMANGVCRVFGLGLTEQGLDLPWGQVSVISDDSGNPLVVSYDSV